MSTLTAGNVTVSCSLSADTSGNLVFQSGGNVTAMTIDSSQNVGIGTSSPGSKLHVAGQIEVTTDTTTPTAGSAYFYKSSVGATVSGFTTVFETGGAGSRAERARIDSSGNLLVGTTSQPISGVNSRLSVSYATSDYSFGVKSTAGTPYGIIVNYSTTPNNTGSEAIYFSDSTTGRFAVRSNGGIANFQANDANLSDRREKTNFAPAGEYLSKICAIPVQTFNYIDQAEDDPGLTLGVVAQDVQAVAPELVSESNWGTKDEPKMRLSIYQTDLQYALMKCIQEQQAMIEELKAKVAALEAQ